MEEKIIKGIKYRLDKETLTAEVIQKKGCSGDIVIPETVVSNKVSYKVTAIGHSTFFNCKSLTSISIPDSVTTIGDSVFVWCESLTSINISKSVINIGKEIFRYCKSLTTIVVDENNQVYDSRDNCNAIIHTATNTLIFGCCKTNIPNSLTNIGNSAFECCPSFTAITIPDSVTSIGEYAFYNCTGLTSIIIPNSVTSIGRSAFYYCVKLTSITIPNSVISIGDYAFSSCTKLTSITIPASVTNIDLCAFFNCPSLTSIIVDENNKVYDSRENCNAIIHTETDTLIAGCQNTIIPQSVINIGTCAFGKCSTLTTISIPDSVENIAGYAFYKCKSLSEINIPYSVTTIGSRAFEDCESLTSISISDVPVEDEELYNQADNFFDNLGIGENLSLKINSSSVFAYCSSLTSVVISKHTTNIGNMTFDGCESLIDIRYTGTIEQWQEIKLGTCWNRDVPTKIVHCTNGDVEVEIEE